MNTSPIIVWFRRDLRLSDNPALHHAIASKRPLIFVYVHDETKPRTEGGASRWWLHYSLTALKDDLKKRGGDLLIRSGNSVDCIKDLVIETGARSVHCSRLTEPFELAIDESLTDILSALETEYKAFAGYLLFDPLHIKSKTGTPYKVFTPFWRTCLDALHIAKPIPKPHSFPNLERRKLEGCSLADLTLRPSKPNWAKGFNEYWTPGEAGAKANLKTFIHDSLNQYKRGRDFPGDAFTSRLSPHLHFGEITPHQIIYAINDTKVELNQEDKRHFLSELGWREFSHYLLYHFPQLQDRPFNPKFSKFPWKRSKKALTAWQRGQTGIPIVDAGMRELWHTGWMHNRVRMIVASLLTKNCMISWRDGEEWFWDTLVDANLANNCAGWQWVAGSGADAAPYFRIFNPVTQSERFDPEGVYLRKWVPELAQLPNKKIHAPWKASEEELHSANIELGSNYPLPIVDVKLSREAALDAYKSI